MLPTKVDSISKVSTHNSQDHEFDFCYWYKDFVGNWSVSISINNYKVWWHTLILMSLQNLIHLNFHLRKKILHMFDYYMILFSNDLHSKTMSWHVKPWDPFIVENRKHGKNYIVLYFGALEFRFFKSLSFASLLILVMGYLWI